MKTGRPKGFAIFIRIMVNRQREQHLKPGSEREIAMKNFLFIALLFASTAAFAAEGSVATPPSTPLGQSAGNGERPKMNFDERKAKILARIHEKEACVNAATTPEALKACMPHRGEHRGQWGKGEGKGGGFGGGRLNNKGDGNNSDGAGNSENAPGQQ
jgi:hypothetical protein